MSRRTHGMAGAIVLLLLLQLGALGVAADAPLASDAFARTWARTDRPVAEGDVDRTWVWGPAISGVVPEEYAESPGDTREVQYYDKSRMEVTRPDAPDDGLWYVTNGLLVVELISGRMQVGDDAFVQRLPAELNVAGDQGFVNGPTYATFRPFITPFPEPEDHGGALVVERIDAAGLVTTDDSLAGQDVQLVFYDATTSHNIAAPFWEFMNAEGSVEAGNALAVERLFINPFYATGRPITEPYWSDVVVAGTEQLVLIQCFERRCLTWTPGNDPGWRVETGNVGQHYYEWRYAELPQVEGQVLFYRTRYDPATERSTTDIYTINADGANERNLTAGFGLNAGFARWSPDGSQIAFWGTSDTSVERYSFNLYVVDADGGNLRQITSVGEGIDWSPDGSQIAFTRPIAPFNTQIFVINTDGTGERQLTNIPPDEQSTGYLMSKSFFADWSPDGTRIAFANQNRDIPGSWRSGIYIINADGTGLVELLPQENAYTMPMWSPDGRTLLIYKPQTAGRDVFADTIYIVDGAIGAPSLATVTGGDGSRPGPPSWSPDGTQIAAATTPVQVTPGLGRIEGTRGIHLIDPETHAHRQITHAGELPAWSADGRFLVYTLQTDNQSHFEPSQVVATDAAGRTQWIVTSDGWGAQWRPGAGG